MSRKPRPSFLDEAVELLVQHFGINRIQTALANVSKGAVEAPEAKARRTPSKRNHLVNPPISTALQQVRHKDEEKYVLLADFYTQLKDRKVLPESQDIHQFAQLIGLKEIRGKSRKDLLPRLMRFLVELPIERLEVDIKRAATVSEQERQQGFSVLTDKLLGDK